MSLMKSSVTLPIALVMSGLTACTPGHYCSKPIAYQSTPSVPVVRSVGEIKVEPSASAYVVPPVPTSPQQPFGQQVPNPKRNGKLKWSCLDQPPPFTPSAAPLSTPPATAATKPS